MLVVLRLWESEDEDFMLTPSGGSESSMRTQAPAPDLKSALVYAFPKPHLIGSICHPPCYQCGDRGDGRHNPETTDAKGNELPNVAFLILAEATKDQWREHIRQCGGGEVPKHELRERLWYYFVSTD